MTPTERFLAKANITPTCWLWTGVTQRNGYGRFWLNGRTEMAHRASYILFVGSIPSDKQIDHLCRNRGCVNPKHLDPKTPKDNTLAPGSLAPSALNAIKTHCPQGHPYDEDNTYVWKGRVRKCRKCRCKSVAACKRRARARAKETDVAAQE